MTGIVVVLEDGHPVITAAPEHDTITATLLADTALGRTHGHLNVDVLVIGTAGMGIGVVEYQVGSRIYDPAAGAYAYTLTRVTE